MPATIRDIREKTGLSLATISKYLNGGNVLPKNREMIEKAVEELHYEVNEFARGLVTKKSHMVGVLVYSVECMFAMNLVHFMGEQLREKGYGMLICDSCHDRKVEEENLRFLLSRKVDGIIAFTVGTADGATFRMAKEENVPIVLLDRDSESGEFDSVLLENRGAMHRMTNELIKANHKKIAIVASDVEYTGIERMRGYEDAMREAGLPIPKGYKQVGVHSWETGYERMKNLLNLEERPTAVILTNYETTLGGLMAINEAGLNCPEDISITGFDNLSLCDVLKPRLWTVVQPMKEMGEKAVEILLQRMNETEKKSPFSVSFQASIKEGKSIKQL